MRKEGIQSIIRKKWKISTTDWKHKFPVCDNILNRDFHADQIGTKWVSDITYLKTGEGWLYLTAVMDLADRKIIGWTLSDSKIAPITELARAYRQIFNLVTVKLHPLQNWQGHTGKSSTKKQRGR